MIEIKVDLAEKLKVNVCINMQENSNAIHVCDDDWCKSNDDDCNAATADDDLRAK